MNQENLQLQNTKTNWEEPSIARCPVGRRSTTPEPVESAMLTGTLFTRSKSDLNRYQTRWEGKIKSEEGAAGRTRPINLRIAPLSGCQRRWEVPGPPSGYAVAAGR
jgi:hypothetical protein